MQVICNTASRGGVIMRIIKLIYNTNESDVTVGNLYSEVISPYPMLAV